METSNIMETKPMGLKARIKNKEQSEIRRALRAAKGKITDAAASLGMSPSLLGYKLRNTYPDLGSLAGDLREKNGQSRGRGRPRKPRRDGPRSKAKIRAAWKKHGTYAGVARDLGIPASTVRSLVNEYGIHSP